MLGNVSEFKIFDTSQFKETRHYIVHLLVSVPKFRASASSSSVLVSLLLRPCALGFPAFCRRGFATYYCLSAIGYWLLAIGYRTNLCASASLRLRVKFSPHPLGSDLPVINQPRLPHKYRHCHVRAPTHVLYRFQSVRVKKFDIIHPRIGFAMDKRL